MKRDVYKKLIEWKETKGRKPLVLRGARQVGKTYLLKLFGKENYDNLIYVNFEETPKLKTLFEQNLDPQRIIRDLGIYFNQEILPKKSLIFFDEIQECPNALTSLKYFQEQASEYDIVSAGSLLGVKLARTKGFPVGKVTFIELYPCSFFEFLENIGNAKLRNYLEDINTIEPLTEVIHEQLTDLLRLYYFIGGMPEAVKSYIDNQNLNNVRKIHQDILDAYLLDFSKHAPTNEIMKITAAWNSIPTQLARENKKFTFAGITQSARAREYESAIEWLSDAGLILRSFCITAPRLPIESYSDKRAFKVFLLDVGLLSTMTDLPAKAILNGDKLFTEFKGALTENFVAQELKTNLRNALYYWATQGQAEVDFVIPFEGVIYPLEVKSGLATKQKSLAVYREKYQPQLSGRASLLNLKKEKDFYNFPLYMVSLFPEKAIQFGTK